MQENNGFDNWGLNTDESARKFGGSKAESPVVLSAQETPVVAQETESPETEIPAVAPAELSMKEQIDAAYTERGADRVKKEDKDKVRIEDETDKAWKQRESSTAATKLKEKRAKASESKKNRKEIRINQRELDAEKRSKVWSERWGRFKSGAKKAWEGTKAGVKAIPDLPSYTMDLVDDVYDASAGYVNKHAVKAVNKIDRITTNLGDEVVAAGNFLGTLGKTLKTSYARERMVARVDSLTKVHENKIDPNKPTNFGAEAELQAGAAKALKLEAKIRELQKEIDKTRTKKTKLKKAGGWLRDFLSYKKN